MVSPPRRHDSQRRDGQSRRSRDEHGRQPAGQSDSEMKSLGPRIVLTPGTSISPDLFDDVADRAARIVAGEGTRNSQLRRFYDELLRWEDKVNGGEPKDAEARLREQLPFIRMMNAKAAYAKGRKLVGAAFVEMLRRCLEQVNDDPGALRNCRLFFEAFMGFHKLHDPQD